MAGYFRAPRRTFRTSAAIAQYLRVKVGTDGRIAVAGANESDVGTTAREAFAENEEVAVNLASLEGTDIYIASVEITAGDKVYGAASGKIGTSASSTVPIGIALFSAVADQQVEVLRRQI